MINGTKLFSLDKAMKSTCIYLTVIGCIAFASCESNEYSEELVDSTTMMVPDNTRNEARENLPPYTDTIGRTDTTPSDTGNINIGRERRESEKIQIHNIYHQIIFMKP